MNGSDRVAPETPEAAAFLSVARPARPLPHRGRPGQERRRPLASTRRGRDPRHRRRVGLGQVGDQPGHPGPAQGLAAPRSPARSGSTARNSSAPEGEMRALRGERDGDDLPGSAVVDAPVLHGRRADREAYRVHNKVSQQGRAQAHGRDAGPGRHPQPRAALRRLPAPVLRRHAPARDDRDGARLRPEAAHRRRADHGARRHGPGADPRADEGPAARVQLRDHPDHPRPRRRRRDV